MSNDNNKPKTASEMLFHELAANGGTKRDTQDIVDRLNTFTANNADWPTIADAAQEIRDLRETVNDLSGWAEGVEADNDTLRKEIARLREERDESRRMFCEFVSQDRIEGYVDHPNPRPEDVAREQGWDCYGPLENQSRFCDECGELTKPDDLYFYAELPCDVHSANKGESAMICSECNPRIEAHYDKQDADSGNDDFRTTDMS